MKYDVYISVGEVDAPDRVTAMTKALKILDDLAGSNGGSEVLANATPVLLDEGETL